MTTVSMPPETEAAICAAGEAAGRAEELRLRAQWLIASSATGRSTEPAAVKGGPPWTKAEFGARHKKHPSWVDRCVVSGMPHEWAGSSKRFTIASEAWVTAQGKFAAKVNAKAPADDTIDITKAMQAGGLRVVGGQR